MMSVWRSLLMSSALLVVGRVTLRVAERLPGELVALALKLHEVNHGVCVLLVRPEGDVRPETEVVVRRGVERVLQPLPGDVEPQLLQRLTEQVGPDEARDRPGGVVDLGVVLRDGLAVAAEARRVLVVRGPMARGDPPCPGGAGPRGRGVGVGDGPA